MKMAIVHTGDPMDPGTLKVIATLIEQMMRQDHPHSITAVADDDGNIVELDA
jgi:hypothetical protein